MPRRRPSSKSKSSSKPRPVDRKDSKIKRWDKASDIELDAEDQFHASRDKILLDGGDQYDEDGEDEEEVFALEGMSDDEDEDEDAENYEEEEDIDMDEEANEAPTKKSTQKSSKSKSKKSKDSSPHPDSESEEETWGRGKGAYYSSNAAQLDSDDEEANELEEQEALRLQAKARDVMGEDDFGLGDMVEADDESGDVGEIEDEAPKPVVKEIPKDKQSALRFLEKESPETLALARDWEDTARNLVETKARVDAMKESEIDTMELSLQHMYYQSLLTYATSLAFYLHLRASEKYSSRPDLLRSHPVLKRLLALKQALSTLESLGIGRDTGSDEEDEDEEDEEADLADLIGDGDGEPGTLWSLIQKKGLEADELADLLEDAAALSPSSPEGEKKKKNKRKGTNDKAEVPPKKKRKTADSIPPAQVFDLVEPSYAPSSSSKKKKPPALTPTPVSEETDAYGDPTSLSHTDLTDKNARKKSLRFHISRIESSSSRRTNARANAVGGDDDIPYRERRKERERREEREREKRREGGKLGTGGDDLDDGEPEDGGDGEGGKKRKKRSRDEEDGDGDDATEVNGYYDLVKQAAASKKAQKKAEYEAATARPDLDLDDTTGPRSVTRAILKNKGLTPHRPKAVRNPRVKKRQKYEKAKKRVSSQKAVYKGGIGDVGKYSGEQSGISKVVKSVSLG
ncbi:hypothetical protein HYDPIDRAFT_28421 [Hydnomerulius pinastri MD-312]|uniref:Sas10 C-terminal domain-containing protein n=1 Tax=Hydnomerulius pinastri MD-312 TaxID=994086 RepID=A0A0C9W0Y6_9AGAM|nr:hypothetical protein HYDPIDRAFT_28421 [Hydnomerulius pinastri MD-312]